MCALQTITLVKVDGTVGMSIVGGINKVCHPFGVTQRGIFISKVPYLHYLLIYWLDIHYSSAAQSGCYVCYVKVPQLDVRSEIFK